MANGTRAYRGVLPQGALGFPDLERVMNTSQAAQDIGCYQQKPMASLSSTPVDDRDRKYVDTVYPAC